MDAVTKIQLDYLAETLARIAAHVADAEKNASLEHRDEVEAKYPGDRSHLVYPTLYGEMRGSMICIGITLASAQRQLARITAENEVEREAA
jgi:hypothetical protein